MKYKIIDLFAGIGGIRLGFERAAKKNNISPQVFTDQMSQNFKNLTKFLNCSNNDFIRTTEERHKNSVQHLWNIL